MNRVNMLARKHPVHIRLPLSLCPVSSTIRRGWSGRSFRWKGDLQSSRPPTRYPVGVEEMAGVEVRPGQTTGAGALTR